MIGGVGSFQGGQFVTSGAAGANSSSQASSNISQGGQSLEGSKGMQMITDVVSQGSGSQSSTMMKNGALVVMKTIENLLSIDSSDDSKKANKAASELYKAMMALQSNGLNNLQDATSSSQGVSAASSVSTNVGMQGGGTPAA